MNSTVNREIELSAVLNLIPYLDTDFEYQDEVTLAQIIYKNEEDFIDENGKLDSTFQLLKTAIEQNPSYGEIVLVNQNSTENIGKWTDNLIQACTFRDADGNYYVAYRGTGDGRWVDNGDGMTAPSTEMQEAAREYFDSMAKEYFIDVSGRDEKRTNKKGITIRSYV